MATKDAGIKPNRILASVGFFHQTLQKIGRSLPIPSPTYFRIWKTPLIADCFVGHEPTHRLFRSKTAVRSSPPPSSLLHNQLLPPGNSKNSPSGCRLGSRPPSPASRWRNSSPSPPC